ncbi:TnpV protein, partial [Holdemania massiliensis]
MHTEAQTLGKYGRTRRIFLEQNNSMLFNHMVLTETLFPHLWEVQQTCEKRMELLMANLLVKN